MPRLKKPRLVPYWRDAWRWFSVHSMALAMAVQGAWLMVPDDLRDHLQRVAPWVSITILVFGLIGRLIEQEKSQ
ncbi:MAG: hypothetical protein IRZ03_13605 [Acidobacterium ailaaui]|nr:hypothetical protein [Pseudacidobacterium ailaaui]